MPEPKRIIISSSAQQDIDEILRNVVEYTSYTATAIKLLDEFHAKFETISRLPQIGKNIGDGKQQCFARSYRIVYQEFDDHIKIITVIHARRLYPR